MSVGANVALPWLPALIVVSYGGCLVYAQQKGHVSHSDLTKNSPYFLGFVLFLFSLFITFTRYGQHSESLQMEFVIRQLGASLLTTVVGLPFRQWLFAYDPDQQEQDLFYHALEEELRRSAAQFKKSQVELVGLVEEFVEARKTLFADEQAASERYIGNLKRAVSLFDSSLSEYPTVISSALNACSQSVAQLKAKLEALSTAVEHLDSTQLQQAEASLAKLKDQASVLTDGVKMLTHSVEGLVTNAKSIPGVVAQVFDSASTIAAEGVGQLRTQLAVLIKDVGDIDKLITEFVEMQKLKVVGEYGGSLNRPAS